MTIFLNWTKYNVQEFPIKLHISKTAIPKIIHEEDVKCRGVAKEMVGFCSIARKGYFQKRCIDEALQAKITV